MCDKEREMEISEKSFLLEYEKVARSRWWQEDSLVHNRLTWLLQSQIILFAAYGWFVRTEDPTEKLLALTNLLPVIGLLICLIIAISVSAAWKAQEVLVKEYSGKFILGVSDSTTKSGRIAGKWLPIIFGVSWAYLLLTTAWVSIRG